MNDRDPTSWPEWSRHVLAELERGHRERAELRNILVTLQVEVATLKVKAGLWGGVTGLVAGVAAAIAQLLGSG